MELYDFQGVALIFVAVRSLIMFFSMKYDGVTNIPAKASSTSDNTPDNIDNLEKIANMLEKGILTQDEFDAKKKELLGLS
jgi:hypothetical protein